MDTLPDHIAELVNIVLEEQLMFSLSNDMADLGREEVRMMEQYFRFTKNFPQRLVTQNCPLMQHAYLAVPNEVWIKRVLDLQCALQSSRNAEWKRRSMVTQSPAVNMPPWVTDILDKAFLNKYDELLLRVKYDFQDFFPYRIGSTSPQLMVFEKLSQFELIECVLSRF